MDSRVVINKLQEHFDHSTADGRSRAQRILEILIGRQRLGVKELIKWAVELVVGGSFTHGDCWVLRTLLHLHIRQSALTDNHDKRGEVVRDICSGTDIALKQGCYIIQVFYFFYETMVFVTAAVSEGSESGQKMANQCASTANVLWATFFNDTRLWRKDEKATIELLKHLRYLAIKHCENNPGFCFCLCHHLLKAFNTMAYLFTEDQARRIKAYLLVTMARCCFQAKQYRHCTQLCEQACELEEYQCYIPLELWASALDKERQFCAALDKLQDALKCVMEKEDGEVDYWEIIEELQDFISNLKLKMLSEEEQSTQLDPDWLTDTNVHTPEVQCEQALRMKDGHIKKKKRSRPKTRKSADKEQVGELDCLKGISVLPSNSSSQHPLTIATDNIPFLQYKQWDLSSGDGESDLEDAFQLPEPEHNETEPQVAKVKPEVQDRTWFDESRDEWNNSKMLKGLFCGMETNLDVSQFEAGTKQQTRGPFYQEMKSVDEMKFLMAKSPERYKRCRLELESPHKAVCKVLNRSETYREIEIHGRSKCGQTFNNDEVCVEVLAKPSIISDQKTYRNTQKEDAKVYGRVVGVLKRTFREQSHPVMACTCDNDEGFLMRPLCRTVLKMHALNRVTKKNHPSLAKHRIDMYELNEEGHLVFKRYFDVKPKLKDKYVFLVVYITWGVHHVYPLGAVVEVMDCGTDFHGGLKILEMQYKVPTLYPQDTVVHIGKLLEKKAVDTDGRVDCTGLEVFTIDPAHSKDLDDALNISKEDDHYLIGVHIADVAAVVKKGDPVDREAQKRATSFYPCVSRTHNMLPEPLSEGLCSLLPHEEKLALSVFFHMEKSGKRLKEATVRKTRIKSSCKLSYENAQKIIENEEVGDVSQSLKDSVTLLHEIAQNLRKDRLNDSRFAVPFEDPRFIETEILEQNMEAHALVEEFMIKANTSIAQWLRKKFPHSIPIRCQPPPSTEDAQKFVQSEEKFLDLVVNLQGREVLPGRKVASQNWVAKGNTVRKEPLPVQRNIWLQILDDVHNETLDKTVRNMCKDEVHPFQAIALQHWRSIMESAEYKCSMLSEKELSHFSLNTKMYTHFTSPIRRYVDLVVHRLVHAALDGTPCPYSPTEINDLCVHINDATSRQKHFSNGCQALKRAAKISQKPMMFNAVVEKVTDSGAELCIPSLKHIQSKSKELPFNLMDFSKKPEEKQDPWSSKTIITGKWKKRLYDCTGCPSQLTYSKMLEKQQGPNQKRPKQVSVVDPNQHVYFVDTQTWAKMLIALFSQDLKTLKKMVNSQPQDGQEFPLGAPVRDMVTSEYGDGSIKFQQCKFTLCFKPGRVIKVQMVANPMKGLLTPQVRLFQVCKNLSLCLSHIEDPVGVLSEYATESTNRTFESVAEYQRTWLPLLEMNAAMTAATNEENVIINNVSIDFKQGQMKPHTGSFTLQGNFMRERCIEFGGKSIDKLKEEDFNDENSGIGKVVPIEYLCIRCPLPQITNAPNEMDTEETQSTRKTKSSTKHKKGIAKTAHTCDIASSESYTWVGHAQILKVRRRGKKTDSDGVDILFSLNSNSDPVPEYLRSKASGTVELIMKSEVDRRTIAMLQHLGSEHYDLAEAIALDGSLPELENKRLKACSQVETEIPHRLLPPNNDMQEEAISQALTSSFSLIQGPPGTGKTYTGIKLIYLFEKINWTMHQEGTDKKKKQVLFCGPSNKAVDLVGRLLIKRLAGLCPKIIRVYGQNIVSQDYPVPRRNFVSRKSLHGLNSDKALRNVSLHHMIRQQDKPYANEIKWFDSFFLNNYDDVTSDHVHRYSELIFKASCEELEKCDVILSTCAVGGNKTVASANIFQVIIDESAMSTEPQTMVPIIATKAEQVVLIGDHMQLRPIVQCKAAADLGLTRSLFERYASQAVFLDTQYRMHPKICQIPSDMFYKGGLTTGNSQLWRTDRPLRLWPVLGVPYLLWHVEGTEHVLSVSAEEGNEQSRSNSAEVDIVEEVFRWLTKKEKIDPTNINVMSQYNAQCSRIKEKLTRYHLFPNVNTVVASQGGEWDYVIFSTVRSLPPYKIERRPTLGWRIQNLGFITDANQVNVALTRARKGLIIIGNVNLLRTDDVFGQVVTRYEAQGCVVEGQCCPPARRQRSI